MYIAHCDECNCAVSVNEEGHCQGCGKHVFDINCVETNDIAGRVAEIDDMLRDFYSQFDYSASAEIAEQIANLEEERADLISRMV